MHILIKKSQFKNSKLQVISHNDINIRNFIIEALDLYINKNHVDEMKNHKNFGIYIINIVLKNIK